jgi:plasmid stability protein
MFEAWHYVEYMTRMIQIRNVPDDLHRLLKSRAALAGQSLSDYLLEELKRVAQRPTLTELAERIKSRSQVTPPVSPAEAVRVERESR